MVSQDKVERVIKKLILKTTNKKMYWSLYNTPDYIGTSHIRGRVRRQRHVSYYKTPCMGRVFSLYYNISEVLVLGIEVRGYEIWSVEDLPLLFELEKAIFVNQQEVADIFDSLLKD